MLEYCRWLPWMPKRFWRQIRNWNSPNTRGSETFWTEGAGKSTQIYRRIEENYRRTNARNGKKRALVLLFVCNVTFAPYRKEYNTVRQNPIKVWHKPHTAL